MGRTRQDITNVRETFRSKATIIGCGRCYAEDTPDTNAAEERRSHFTMNRRHATFAARRKGRYGTHEGARVFSINKDTSGEFIRGRRIMVRFG